MIPINSYQTIKFLSILNFIHAIFFSRGFLKVANLSASSETNLFLITLCSGPPQELHEPMFFCFPRWHEPHAECWQGRTILGKSAGVPSFIYWLHMSQVRKDSTTLKSYWSSIINYSAHCSVFLALAICSSTLSSSYV